MSAWLNSSSFSHKSIHMWRTERVSLSNSLTHTHSYYLPHWASRTHACTQANAITQSSCGSYSGLMYVDISAEGSFISEHYNVCFLWECLFVFSATQTPVIIAFTAFACDSDVHPSSLRWHSRWKTLKWHLCFLLGQHYSRFWRHCLMLFDWLRELAWHSTAAPSTLTSVTSPRTWLSLSKRRVIIARRHSKWRYRRF